MVTINKRIIIVDDNEDVRHEISLALRHEEGATNKITDLENILFSESKENTASFDQSYEITTAEQGLEAVECVRAATEAKKPYSLAFVDMRMPPGIDGLETIKRIWTIAPYTEIVLCTAFSDHSFEDIMYTLDNPQRLIILKKPFDPLEIKQLAASLTTKWTYGVENRLNVEQLEAIIKERNQFLDAERAMRIQNAKMAALGEMAGGIAHEINNPLAIICGNASRMKRLVSHENFDKQSIDGVADKILQTSHRISKIIQSMLSVVRQDNSNIHQPHSLQKMINDCLAICQEKFRTHGIDILVDPVPESVWVECDDTQIIQVFINLLNNAFDALQTSDEEEKWLKIHFAIIGGKIEIRIIDSGPGIPDHLQEKILQPFFTTKPVGAGTGLGLSLTSSFIQNHKGRFYLDKTNSNTCFVIELDVFQQKSKISLPNDDLALKRNVESTL
ncbi:MAG: response regulator [Pseudobacteriovorax sp.]|nr:response regulator [Pseudobacteriovorax sp.]